MIDVFEMKGPLGELYDQCSGENGRARFEEFKLWLKKVATGSFKRDMRKEGWTLLENAPRRLSSAINEVSFLKNGESSISGEEMVRRARVELNANYGQEDAEWLLKHQDKIPAELRKLYLVFPATVWQDRYDDRYVPYLSWYDDRSILDFRWLDGGFYSNDRLVRPRR